MGAVHMQITTIGLDIAKNVFQVHGIDGDETVVVRKQLRRGKLIAFFESLAPCLVGIEACATAHHWARELTRLGHQVRLMPAKDVKAYVKRNKNDAADAAAICEAVRRPTMRFVRIKSTDQQCQLMQHRTRDLMMRQRTQLINALRAHLAELGIVAAMGDKGVTELLMIVADEDDGRLPVEARASLALLAAQLNALQMLIGSLEKCSIAPTRRANGSRPSRASASSGRPRLRQRLQTRRFFDRDAILRRGSDWCRGKNRAEASISLDRSPSEATAICVAFSSSARTPSCDGPWRSLGNIPGSPSSWRGAPSR